MTAQHIQYNKQLLMLSTLILAQISKSMFCNKMTCVFCIISRIENRLCMCYTTVRKGDTNVQVKLQRTKALDQGEFPTYKRLAYENED